MKAPMTEQPPAQPQGDAARCGGSRSLIDDLGVLQEDLRRRWERADRVLVEEYLSADALANTAPDDLLDLIYHEVMIREEFGEHPALGEYLERFPQFTGQLRDQFEVHQALKLDQWLGQAGTGETAQGSSLAAGEPRASGTGPSIPGYEVIRELGRGGMGVVYLARQTGLERLVALKMILAGEFSRQQDRVRFQREAEAVARLEHPNLVKIYETGEQDGRPYFSMEYLEGGRLADSLRGTPLPPRRAAQLVETLARATHAAHERGVIHRDLTPNNVLLTAMGEPKIVDFGLAKLTIDGTGRTATGDILGTPSYMAPEQATGQSKEVGPAADVYALGAILYDLLTGRPPFKGDSLLATLAQVVHDEPVTPSRLQPRVPRDLETVCLKCLSKEPGHRYLSALALADDLGAVCGGRTRPCAANQCGQPGSPVGQAPACHRFASGRVPDRRDRRVRDGDLERTASTAGAAACRARSEGRGDPPDRRRNGKGARGPAAPAVPGALGGSASGPRAEPLRGWRRRPRPPLAGPERATGS